MKLDKLIASDAWFEMIEAMIVEGKIPNIVAEQQADVIFDNYHQQLTILPASVLRRVVNFYKSDDFINRALEEFRSPNFETVTPYRRLLHVANIRTTLLPNAILAGIHAELALRLSVKLSPLGELAFSRRYTSTYKLHRSSLTIARKSASHRFRKFRTTRYGACICR
jgi:hypothetical protein